MKTHENTKSVMKKITLAICFLTAVCVAKPQQTNNREEVRKYRIQAQAAYSDGDFEEALADYKKAQNLDPQNPEFFKAIGDVYEKLGGTGNLMEAKASYERYLELAPKAADGREIQDRVYVLERQIGKSQKTDDFLNDLSGTWVAMDNLTVGVFYYTADFVFEISRFQQTDTYRVTIIPKGSRYYSEGIIDKTVNIVPQKDQSFNFTFADAQVHTPNQGKYSALRLGAEVAGALSGKSWVSDATNVAIDMKQSNDLPSNTQTAYIFALKYIDGNLKGLVNVVQKYADPTQQRTLKDGLYEITFLKRDDEKFKSILREYTEQQERAREIAQDQQRKEEQAKAATLRKKVLFWKAKLGFQFGMNISNINASMGVYDNLGVKQSSRTSCNGGVLVDVRLWKPLYFQSGILISTRGSVYKYPNRWFYSNDETVYNFKDTWTTRSNLTCMEIPLNLLLNFHLGHGNLFAGGGMYFSPVMSGMEKTVVGSFQGDDVPVEASSTDGDYKKYSTSDYGINFLAGYEFWRGFYLKMGYSIGLKNIYQPGFDWNKEHTFDLIYYPVWIDTPDHTEKNRCFNISMGWKFTFKNRQIR